MEKRKDVATYEVREAGAKLGLGINQSYTEAHSGRWPVIRVGKKRLKVLREPFDRMLRGEIPFPTPKEAA